MKDAFLFVELFCTDDETKRKQNESFSPPRTFFARRGHFSPADALFFASSLTINLDPRAQITGPGGWPRTLGHELKFESPGGNDAGSSFSASRLDAARRMSATELVCASPSQQRLPRTLRSSDSVAAALRAASDIFVI